MRQGIALSVAQAWRRQWKKMCATSLSRRRYERTESLRLDPKSPQRTLRGPIHRPGRRQVHRRAVFHPQDRRERLPRTRRGRDQRGHLDQPEREPRARSCAGARCRAGGDYVRGMVGEVARIARAAGAHSSDDPDAHLSDEAAQAGFRREAPRSDQRRGCRRLVPARLGSQRSRRYAPDLHDIVGLYERRGESRPYRGEPVQGARGPEAPSRP